MSRHAELAQEIQDYCRKNANAEFAKKYQRYFAEGYDAWGLMDQNHPFFNAKQAEWLERYGGMGLKGFLKLGEILFASGKYEEGAIAIRFLKADYFEEINAEVLPGLGKWFEAGIRNWAHTDVLCGEILGPALASGRVPFSALGSWRESKLKYQRRAVPVALLALLKRSFDPADLFAFLRPMMLDPEKPVQQGLGWFFREMWKKCPELVESFLLEWKDTAPRVIFQYATEKMTASGKARFRKAKQTASQPKVAGKGRPVLKKAGRG
jgi:3-methyladenine DNA glycosylase AlkD